MSHFVGVDEPLPGMASPDAAARYLVKHMLAAATEPGYHIFVTHDSLVTATAARLLGVPLRKPSWPKYLEAAFFWNDGTDVCSAYQDLLHARPGALCSLTDLDVLEFARRELMAIIGADCPARVFLAGGAFKSLLTGKRARDFDLWAPSAEDRAALIDLLMARGAQPLEPRRYSDAFALSDRVIEVAHKVVPSTLEGRLGQFDLALSAVGVEHCPGVPMRPPCAHDPALRRW